MLGINDITKVLIGSLVSGLATFVGVSLMMSPIGKIKEEIERIIKNEYNIDGKITTNDFLKKFMIYLRNIKK